MGLAGQGCRRTDSSGEEERERERERESESESEREREDVARRDAV